jgi:putative acetyltransferase
VAEIDGEPVGIGAIVVSNSELRACYVAPSAARRGVGSALVATIEQIAREHLLDHLDLESSITAEPFYSALGYRVESRGEHFLSPGVTMAAVKMRKRLE